MARAQLYFIHARGCPACHATVGQVVSAVKQVQSEAPGQLAAFPIDINQQEWKAERWMPRYTPTLVMIVAGRAFDPKRDVLEGQQSAQQIYRFVKARM